MHDQQRVRLPMFLVLLMFCLSPQYSIGSDLDDGISKYKDETIAKDDEIGQPDKNIKFIIMNAKSKAAMGGKKGSLASGSAARSANMNSVILGPGSNIRGDIIIIDQSKGDKTQVVGQ